MIFVINGSPESGKTTFEHYVQTLVTWWRCHIFSTIDPIKVILEKECDWNGEKTPEARKALSELKKTLDEFCDFSINKTKENIAAIQHTLKEPNIIFIDCREPHNIKRLCEELGAKSLIIRRESAENKETSNGSDANVLNYNYDIEIWNNGTKEDLLEEAIKFIKKEGIKIPPFYFTLDRKIESLA